MPIFSCLTVYIYIYSYKLAGAGHFVASSSQLNHKLKQVLVATRGFGTFGCGMAFEDPIRMFRGASTEAMLIW